jgi:hypothetical protein
MARRPTYSKKSAKLQVEQLQRKCRYCKTHRNAHGFDKHEDWCKKTWMIQRELQDSELRPHSTTNQIQAEAMSLISPKIYSSLRDNNFMEGSSSMPMEVEYPSLDLHPQDSVTVTVPKCTDSIVTESQCVIPVNVYVKIYLVFYGQNLSESNNPPDFTLSQNLPPTFHPWRSPIIWPLQIYLIVCHHFSILYKAASVAI